MLIYARVGLLTPVGYLLPCLAKCGLGFKCLGRNLLSRLVKGGGDANALKDSGMGLLLLAYRYPGNPGGLEAAL